MKQKVFATAALSALLLFTACTKGGGAQTGEAPQNEVQGVGYEHTQNNSPYAIDYEKVMAAAGTPYSVDLKVIETQHTLKDKTQGRFMYTNQEEEVFTGGLPIVVAEGQEVNMHVTNETTVDTNIHWHGLSLPNDQDGPHLLIDKGGGKFSYQFTPDYAGTYWYHSHNRPVRDQVDYGMYGPFVILREEDKAYDVDQIFLLDDWVVNRAGGRMQIEGDVDTINGLSGDDILPLKLTNQNKAKLRFIQASTAKNTTLQFPFEVLVTHTDGMALKAPYKTNSLTFSPGERYDVEVILKGEQSETFYIKNERNRGMVLPVVYEYVKEGAAQDYSEGKPSGRTIDLSKLSDTPDVVAEMSQSMSIRDGHLWTINGKAYPDTDSFDLQLGEVYRIRFSNQTMMFNHPMHIHGAHFQVISENGVPVEEEIWKDTVNVLPRQYVDVAIVFDRPGEWMLHCHILDHEDGGMMTHINVS